MKIDDFLKIAIESEASDLHLKPGNHPILRINGVLKPLTAFPRLTSEHTDGLAGQIMTVHPRHDHVGQEKVQPPHMLRLHLLCLLRG